MNKKLVLLLVLTSITLQSKLFCAAPATHVFFAEHYMNRCKQKYTQKERAAFLRGTLFPDIRYLAHIPRSKTHASHVTLKDVIQQRNPFIAGKLFHSFLDNYRYELVKKENVASVLKPYDYNEKTAHMLLKVIEDEVCYHALDREGILEALKSYDETEKKQGVPFYTIKGWHRHLTTYLKQQPSALFAQRIQQKKGYFLIPAPFLKQVQKTIATLATNKKIIAYFNLLTKEIHALFDRELPLKKN